MTFKIHINNSDYTDWIIYNEETMLVTDFSQNNFNPIKKKLLNCDIFDKNINIKYSPIRNESNIPGILLLIGKTYGRYKPTSKKMYYKCVPNDKRIPAFLIPYESKMINFNKNITNRYILFKYINWIAKHPIGVMTNMLGEINNLPSFYEYQLYCKNLAVSIKNFIKDVNEKMKQNREICYITDIMSKNPSIEDRTAHNIITIDPVGSMDLDDGMSIKDNILSIYIANVPVLMEYFDLWNSFTERISTIYLPDRKHPMLPTPLSENLCSLLENENRFAFCMDIIINENNITDIRFCNTLIKVKKNYRYNDEKILEKDDSYKKILNITRVLCNKYKYIKEIKDSHDIIAFLMILMNYECANKMFAFKDGIYRTLKINENNKIDSNDYPNLSSEIYNFIKIWQSSSGQYTNYDNKNSHELIGQGLDNYIHITSPIRRLVDLLNIMKIQDKLNINQMSSNANIFYNYWINKLDYINTTMRSIRKIQTDCNVLNLCVNNPEILSKIYDGYIFDKIEWNNKYLQYTIYIPEIKIISRVNIKDNLKEYSCWKFKLYLLEDGTTLKKKIRAEIQY
jgi:exoribonuclease R